MSAPSPADQPKAAVSPAGVPATGSSPAGSSTSSVLQPSFGGWLGSMWLYSGLRFGMFFVLWGLLVLLGLHGLFAALIAVVLSVPLSLVLLRKPRANFSRQLQARMDARQVHQQDLDARLQADD